MNVGKEKPKPVVYLDDKDKGSVYDPVKGQTAVSPRALERAREREKKQREDRPSSPAHHPFISRIGNG